MDRLRSVRRLGAKGLIVVNNQPGLVHMTPFNYELEGETSPEKVEIPGAIVQQEFGEALMEEVRNDQEKKEDAIGIYANIKRYECMCVLAY